MDSEIALLTARMEQKTERREAGIVFHEGRLEGQPVVVARCGIGKVCAALCAQAMAVRFGADRLLNTGVAGGLNQSLEIGDMVVSRDAVQHDFDISVFGHAKGYMGFGDSHEPTRFAADPDLIACFERVAPSALGGHNYRVGTIASGDQFIQSLERKQQLIEEFGADAVEMEGAAVAQAASSMGIPFLVLRAISDLAGRQASVSFDQFEQEAANISANLVLAMLREIGR